MGHRQPTLHRQGYSKHRHDCQQLGAAGKAHDNIYLLLIETGCQLVLKISGGCFALMIAYGHLPAAGTGWYGE